MYAVKSFEIKKFKEKKIIEKPDLVVVEEPLEIRIGYGDKSNRKQKSISVTMRTPTGHDFELALGFLFTEGLIQSKNDILSIKYCIDSGKQQQKNIVRVELTPTISLDLEKLERLFYTTSSCGICGKASIEAIQTKCKILPKTKQILSADLILKIPTLVAQKQVFFNHTGGLHAAALISTDENKIWIREDIGRHNALDKIIGFALNENLIPLNNFLLFMSSRASFELIQKAVMAGIQTMICVGSPSSLAIETADEFGMNLIGFLKKDNFNIYTNTEIIFDE